MEIEVESWVGWNFCGWIRVVGVTLYRTSAEHAALYCSENDILSVEREPDNLHDRHAIMVFHHYDLIGYVDKLTARALKKNFSIEMPIQALFKRGYVGPTGAIAIDILPQMPGAKERKEHKWGK